MKLTLSKHKVCNFANHFINKVSSSYVSPVEIMKSNENFDKLFLEWKKTKIEYKIYLHEPCYHRIKKFKSF